MLVKQARPRISLPSGWHGRVKSAVLHTISLAHFSIVHARGMAAGHIRRRVRLSAQNERLREECALLREEIRIKDARMGYIACAPQKLHLHSGREENEPIIMMESIQYWLRDHFSVIIDSMTK